MLRARKKARTYGPGHEEADRCRTQLSCYGIMALEITNDEEGDTKPESCHHRPWRPEVGERGKKTYYRSKERENPQCIHATLPKTCTLFLSFLRYAVNIRG